MKLLCSPKTYLCAAEFWLVRFQYCHTIFFSEKIKFSLSFAWAVVISQFVKV